jgi:hypothetical protein
MAFTPGTGAVISFTVEGASGAQRQIEGIGDSMSGLSTAAKSSLKELAAFAGVGLGLGSLAEQVLGAQRSFDKLNPGLITATGSSTAAAQAFKSLQTFATATPYSLAEVTEAFVLLRNFGLDPSEKAMRAYGNTATALNKDLGQMVEAVADAVTGDFERLTEFGIKAKQNGDKVAMTFKGMTQVIGNNAEEIQGYLQNLGETDFAGAMALRAETLDGAISNLGDAWDQFMLSLSQSGAGDAAKSGVLLLANNLDLLAGSVATVVAAKLGSTFAAWTVDTYKQVSASMALRAATVATAEAEAASATAKVGQLGTTEAMIVVARQEAVARLSSANANIASAEAAIAASTAAGAQSFALRTLRLATAELAVAEAERAAMLAELAVLGRQQVGVSAQLVAARRAEKAAQDALNASTAGGSLAAGVAGRALGLLGGPVGAIITVLGLAATAWSIWGHSAEDGSKQAVESYEDAHKRIVKGLDEQIEKNEKLIQLQNLGMKKPEIDRNQGVLAQLEAASKRLNDINNLTGDYALGHGKNSYDVATDRVKVLNNIAELTEKMRKNDEKAAQAASGSTEAMIAVRQRLTGVNQDYIDTLQKLQAAYDKGEIKQAEYQAALTKLATDTFNSSTAGKALTESIDAQSAAIKRRADVQSVLNERDKEHLAFLQRTGQINEETALAKNADLDLKALNDQKQALADQLTLAKSKKDSQKEQADLTGQIDAMERKIAGRKKKEGEDLFELEQKQYRAAVANSADLIEKDMAELANLKQQTQAQIDYNDQIGLTPKQIAAITAARLEDEAVRKEIEADIAEGLDLTGERAERLRAEADEKRKRAAALVAGGDKQELYDKTLTDLNAMVDVMSALDQAAQSAAQGMADSFGKVGSAIGSLTTALSGYERTQAAIAAQLAAATKDAGGDQTKIQRANAMAAQQSAQAQVRSYSDMASAAKGFFKENTGGYRAMQAAEKTFRAFEMAMAITNMAQKAGLLTTYTAAHAAATATQIATTQASVAPDVAASMMKGQAAAAAGVANQAQGDPYSAWARMAAMAAVMAGLGFAVAGGTSNVSTSEQRQAAQGAGTVLGNSTAKSQSISRAVELTASNSSTQINYLSGMLTSLRGIESNIGAFASVIVRGTDLTNPQFDPGANVINAQRSASMEAMGRSIGNTFGGPILGGFITGTTAYLSSKLPLMGSVSTALFGGEKSVDDSGFTMSKANLAAILAQGANANAYYDIKTSGGYFSHSSHDIKQQTLGADANQQLTLTLKGMADTITQEAAILGVSGSAFTNRLNSFVVDIGMISLKGMSSDEIQSKLEEVFSKVGDQMTSWAVGAITDFAKAGEGPLETLARVATDYAKIDASLQSMGREFGSIGLQSVAAREALLGLMGGVDEFQSKVSGFASDFLTKSQQLVPMQKFVTEQLAAMNLAWVDSREEFAQVTLGLDLNTDAGRQNFAALMNLKDAFAAVYPAIVDTTKSAQEIADERKDLQDQLDELTMTQAQLQEKALQAYDPSNRALAQQVALQRDLKASTTAASDALKSTVERLSATKDSAQAYNNSLLLGTLSTLTPMQKYLETQRQYSAAIDKASLDPSDSAAVSAAQAAATAFLTASQTVNASSSAYLGDKSKVLSDMNELATIATAQMTDAQKQLAALDKQVAGIAQLNDTAAAIQAAIVAQDSSAQATAPAFDVQRYAAGSGAGTEVLAGEVKALREENAAAREVLAAALDELKKLRADANRNADKQLDATEEAGEAVAEAVGGAMEQAAYLVRNPTRVPAR